MILGQIQLIQAHTSGSATFLTTDLTTVLANMDAYPSRATVYSRDNLLRNTTFAVTAIGGSHISLGSVISGADQTYKAGDLVQLQANLADAGGTASIPQTGLTITQSISPATVVTYSSTPSLDCSASNWFEITLTGNPTLTLANLSDGQQVSLWVNQDSSGGRTVTFTNTIRWTNGSAPTLTTTPNKSDVLTFRVNSAGAIAGELTMPNF